MKTVSFIFFVLWGFCVKAQDTLYTVSGQKIPAKIVEVNQNTIKYKKSNNLNGPVYVTDKTNVAMVEYNNGSKEIYNTGAGSSNDRQVITNSNPPPRVNVIVGGAWGWPVYNNWGWWGGYRGYNYYHPYRRYYHPYYGGGHYYRGGGGHYYHGGRRR